LVDYLITTTTPFLEFSMECQSNSLIYDKGKVFHSFRHTFKDALRNSGVDEALSDALTGHSSSSVGRHYGSRLSARNPQ